jgi:hypothetical protein
MTGESRPGEWSDAGGDSAAAPSCGAADAVAGASEGPEAAGSGVKNPTWRILGSTPVDDERGGRRRSIARGARVWPLGRFRSGTETGVTTRVR